MKNTSNFLANAKKLSTKIIARGEASNHAHIITGNADLFELNSEIYIQVYSTAILKHLVETEFLKGNEISANEHLDIPLTSGIYQYVPQIEYDPYQKLVRKVID